MYSLLIGGHRNALSTHTAQMKSVPMGILLSAAATTVAFVVDFFKSQMNF